MDKENRFAPDQPDYRILVAEDHPENRALLRKLLQLAGLEVHEAVKRLIMKEIYELDVYKLSEQLYNLIWYAFDAWPKKVKQTNGYQIIRSSDSIAANLAEGYCRYTPADRKLFYRYARGSFEETKTWFRTLIRRDVITSEEINKGKVIYGNASIFATKENVDKYEFYFVAMNIRNNCFRA